jgi:hypothetical protein
MVPANLGRISIGIQLLNRIPYVFKMLPVFEVTYLKSCDQFPDLPDMVRIFAEGFLQGVDALDFCILLRDFNI